MPYSEQVTRPFDLDEIVRRWQIGHVNGEELPGIAYAALEAGFDSPSLYELAGLDRPSMRDAGPIFRRALNELGGDSAALSRSSRSILS
jgi:hypothetical protein